MLKKEIIDGKALAKQVEESVRSEVAEIVKFGIVPCLVVILVGDNAASKIYTSMKSNAATRVGIKSSIINIGGDISESDLISAIRLLNVDDSVHGILVQLPLPKHISEVSVINAVSPAKDVDCFTEINFGKLVIGANSIFKPCTPMGCMKLIKSVEQDLSGLEAVVIGRSNIVGKPMAHMLLAEDCTVTIAHSKTVDLSSVVMRADIIIAAVGQAKLIKTVKAGSIVIDVGINRLDDGKIVGDVDIEKVLLCGARAVTPVPGGVGPMTVAYLMQNTIAAAKLQASLA